MRGKRAKTTTPQANSERDLRAELERAQALAHIGSWEWDIANDRLTWSTELYRIFGVRTDFPLTFETIAAAVLLEDRARNNEWVARLLDRSTTDEIELRIVRPDGDIRHIHQTATVARDEDGRPVRAHGTIQDISARKQAEIAAETHRVRLHALIENADLSIWAVDRDVRLIVGNTAFHDRLQRDMGRDIGTGEPLLSNDLPDPAIRQWRSYYDRVLSGESFTTEAERRFAGTMGWMEYRFNPIVDRDGAVTGAVVMARDVTEEKAAREALERSEREKALILDSAAEMFAYYDLDLRVRWANRAAGQSVGQTAGELVGRHCFEIWHARSEPCDGCPVHEAAHTKQPAEADITTPDGRTFSLRAYPVLDADGALVGLVEYGLDVTERLRAETVRRESEDLLRQTEEITHAGGWSYDTTTRHVSWTDETYQVLGLDPAAYDPDDIERTISFFAPEVREELAEAWRQVIEEGRPYDLELPCDRADGARIWVRTVARPVVEDGRVTRVVGTFMDVTDRKAAEHALRESERKFRSLTETTLDWVFQVDASGTYTYASPNVEQLMGYRVDEVLGRTPFDFMSPEEAERVGAIFRQIAAGKQRLTGLEDTLLAKDGRPVSFETNATPLLTGGGELVGYFGTCRDISDRKAAEHALRDSERHFRELFTGSRDGIVLVDADGRFLDANPAYCAMLGYSVDELRALEDFFTVTPERWHEWERREIWEGRLLRNGYSGVYEKEYVRKDGAVFPVELQSHAVRDDDGRLLWLWGVARDITTRKAADDALRESEERFRSLVQNVPGVVFRCEPTPPWRDVYVSNSCLEVTGYAAADFVADGRGWDDLILEDDRDTVDRSPDDDGSYSMSYRIRHLDGSIRWVQEIGSYSLDETGSPRHIDGVITDITELKQAEGRLRESEERIRGVFDISPAGIAIIDAATQRFLQVNPGFEEITGYTEEELKELTVAEITHPDDRAREAQQIREYAGGRRPSFSVDKRYVRKDGGIRWVQVTGDLLRPRDDAPALAIANVLDITDRVQAKEQLERSAERLRKTLRDTVTAMGTIVELRDPYTAGHEKEVTRLADAIAAEMGIEERAREGLVMAGEVHDIGKIAVPAEILSKPSTLSDMELRLVRQHPTIGRDLVEAIDFEQPVAEIVVQHHERLDGSGYPAGLTGDQILLEARILAVADVVEAMASHRPYRPALGLDAALDEVRGGAGTLYDPHVVAACDRVFAGGFAFQRAADTTRNSNDRT